MIRNAANWIPNRAKPAASEAAKAPADCVLLSCALPLVELKALLIFVATGPAVVVEDIMVG